MSPNNETTGSTVPDLVTIVVRENGDPNGNFVTMVVDRNNEDELNRALELTMEQIESTVNRLQKAVEIQPFDILDFTGFVILSAMVVGCFWQAFNSHTE